MCGICGYIDYKGTIEDETLNEMVSSMQYRGPNDRGIVISEIPNGKIALGHTRLSIIDLSTAAHQPMSFENLTIVYNGEIYNYKEIREDLIKEGHHFVSNSDTEVLLHSYKEWGTKCVDRFIGMFAFTIYDSEANTISLCRDRAGVKPLYFYKGGDFIAFGSELKSLMAIPQFERIIDQEALSTFLKIGYIPGEACIFKDTIKVDAGQWLIYNIKTHELTKEKYWDIERFYNKPKLQISYEDAKAELKRIFISAFRYRLVSDVPVGVLLSGGFDSAAVTSILSKEVGVTPHTFTIGFHDYINEAPDAEQIAKLLDTTHISQYCGQEDIMDLIPLLPSIFDEPFSDTSALPTIMVSKLVKQHVSVVLSADGGDEIFAGYNSNDKIGKIYGAIKKTPSFLKSPLLYKYAGKVAGRYSSRIEAVLNQLEGFFNDKEFTYKSLFDNRCCFHQNIINYINPSLVQYDARSAFRPIEAMSGSPEYGLVSDWKTIMKDEYLVKVDRSTMSVSLEGREPMLDHRIAEFAAQLPWEYKYKDSIKKRILKDIVYDYLPKELMDKPKRGFSPPVMMWMRSGLKDFVYCNLSKDVLGETGFEYNRTAEALERFMRGNDYYYSIVWRLLQFQCWYKYWVKI